MPTPSTGIVQRAINALRAAGCRCPLAWSDQHRAVAPATICDVTSQSNACPHAAPVADPNDTFDSGSGHSAPVDRPRT